MALTVYVTGAKWFSMQLEGVDSYTMMSSPLGPIEANSRVRPLTPIGGEPIMIQVL